MATWPVGYEAVTVKVAILRPSLTIAIGWNTFAKSPPRAESGLTPVALLSGSLWTRATTRLTEGAVKSSIHRIKWEQSFLLISASHRAAAKLLVDGAAARIAEGLAALLLYVWLVLVVCGEDLRHHDASWIAYLLLLALLAWIMLTTALGRMQSRVRDVNAGSGFPTPDR
jgi:hypothetical protein